MPSNYFSTEAKNGGVMKFWVGVKRQSPHDVFRAEEADVTEVKYPQYSYVVGPFETQALADLEANTHVNQDGMFIDPFSNGGSGR